jgi:hypothetical protein
LPTADEVRAQQQVRAQFINALWDMQAESGAERVLTDAVLARINVELPDVQIDRLTSELHSDHLIDADRRAYEEPYLTEVWLTSSGRREVEQWITTDRPTRNLPLAHSTIFNTTIYGGVHGSAVVVGSTATTVNIHNSYGHQLVALTAKSRRLLETQQDLPTDQREDIEDDLALLNEQAAAAQPDHARIRSAVRRVAAWSGGIVAGGAAAALKPEVQQLTSDLLKAIT